MINVNSLSIDFYRRIRYCVAFDQYTKDDNSYFMLKLLAEGDGIGHKRFVQPNYDLTIEPKVYNHRVYKTLGTSLIKCPTLFCRLNIPAFF